MARFDRQDATSDLRATLEEKLHEIIEAAEAQAHDIEDRALEQALEIERDVEERTKRRFESATGRIQQMVAAIDEFEREVTAAFATLRQKGEVLASQLDGEARPEPQAAAPAEAPQEPETPEAEPPSDDQREGVRRRILDMFLAGKPRVEAERMLTQLQEGSQYTDLIDEVYEPRTETQQGAARRRGGRRRRRPGS